MIEHTTVRIASDLAAADISEQLKLEITVYRILRPLIGRCLTLNHDLNNPLTGVMGYAEFLLLDKDGMSKDQRDNLQQIVSCAERMKALIDELAAEKSKVKDLVDLKAVTEELTGPESGD